MISFQERHLKIYLIDTFIAVHKSKELNKEMDTWERSILMVKEDKIEEVCEKIAKNVTLFIESEKKKGKTLTNTQIVNKIKEELNNL